MKPKLYIKPEGNNGPPLSISFEKTFASPSQLNKLTVDALGVVSKFVKYTYTGKPRTQKALSLFADPNHFQHLLKEFGVTIPPTPKIFPHHMAGGTLKFPVFARPCPVQPRHGFVNSKVVNNWMDLMYLISAMLREDPLGEVILMEKCSGKRSAVLAPNGVSWGSKNDGATSGLGADIIPVATTKVGLETAHLNCQAIRVRDQPYFEFVEDEGFSKLVQVRDGPTLPQTRDFIPRKITVKNIIRPYDFSWAQWEKKIKEAGKNDIVVLHKGTLSSHPAIQAILADIPVICSRSDIYKGSVLTPEDETYNKPSCGHLSPVYLEKLSATMLSTFVTLGVSHEDGKHQKVSVHHKNSGYLSDYIRGGIGCCHVAALWPSETRLAALLGTLIPITAMCCAAACVGEDRHWWESGPPNYEPDIPSIEQPSCTLIMRDTGSVSNLGRSTLYQTALNFDPQTLIEECKNTSLDFEAGKWEKDFGGEAWAKAADRTVECLEKCLEFVETPTNMRWLAVLASYNSLIHTVHNSGKLLSKFVPGDVLNIAPSIPALCFVNDGVGSLFLNGTNIVSSVLSVAHINRKIIFGQKG